MIITIYSDETEDMFSDDILQEISMVDVEIPREIVFGFFKAECLAYYRNESDDKEGITDEGYFEDWLNEYTCDDTIGLWEYARKNNVTPLLDGWWK